MNSKHIKILKNIFLSSVATIFSVDSNANIYNIDKIKLSLNEDENSLNIDKSLRLSPKLIIKFNDDNSYSTLAHKSHSSHSSHSSHRSHSSHSSHYSGYNSNDAKTVYPTTPAKTTKKTPVDTTPKSTPVYTTPKTPNNTSLKETDKKNSTPNYDNHFNLGDRVLRIGMSGTDVEELIDLLEIEGYYIKNDVNYVYDTFDIGVENAVKKFQKDKGLTDDGVVGAKTIYYLKK
jgi:murein L,D-transpeptidase YcbB/YkuD